MSEVTCPVCGASGDEWCTTPSGRGHAARYAALGVVVERATAYVSTVKLDGITLGTVERDLYATNASPRGGAYRTRYYARTPRGGYVGAGDTRTEAVGNLVHRHQSANAGE